MEERSFARYIKWIENGAGIVTLHATAKGSKEEKKRFVELACAKEIDVDYRGILFELSDKEEQVSLYKLLLGTKEEQKDMKEKIQYEIDEKNAKAEKEYKEQIQKEIFYNISEGNGPNGSHYYVSIGKAENLGQMIGIGDSYQIVPKGRDSTFFNTLEEAKHYIKEMKTTKYPSLKKW
ncbi:hypothetical protein [Neobacillus ginsengisoli]|uniref:Uncharacterized protein n=1 Tax=Neobacillus ginsengisoli TaxID=904295 RepID=A0ABT9XNF8_9BACI|nr:hypothetical protein [Neobacillus ginsengisoli]MDQ0197072.1 hypothetical protein [Neobacillus ginsengisoli]